MLQRLLVDLLDVQAFLQVAQSGGFARAASLLALDKSIVSRRVARLEGVLGARLLERGAGGVQLTEVGRAYLERAAGGLAELEAAGEEVARALSAVAGPIRVTAPVSLGNLHLAPALAAFVDRHPEVELDVSFDDRMADLVGGGFDLAVRVGNLRDSTLVARRLSRAELVLVASPAYLAQHGPPLVPKDVGAHHHLQYGNNIVGEHWRFRVEGGWEQVHVRPRLRADSPDMLRAAAVAGLGLTVLPTFVVAASLEIGELVALMPDHPVEGVGVWAVTPPGRNALARVRALIDFLARRFAEAPVWDPSWLGDAKARAAVAAARAS